MKKGILLFLSLFFAFVMSAQERTENDAASIARSFFNGATKRNTAEKQSELRFVAVYRSAERRVGQECVV